MTMRIEPIGNRVAVKRADAAQMYGSIHLPGTAMDKPQQATVVAVGPGMLGTNGDIIPMSVKEGDVVLLAQWGGAEVELDGEKIVIVREDELLGIVREEEKATGSIPRGRRAA